MVLRSARRQTGSLTRICRLRTSIRSASRSSARNRGSVSVRIPQLGGEHPLGGFLIDHHGGRKSRAATVEEPVEQLNFGVVNLVILNRSRQFMKGTIERGEQSHGQLATLKQAHAEWLGTDEENVARFECAGVNLVAGQAGYGGAVKEPQELIWWTSCSPPSSPVRKASVRPLATTWKPLTGSPSRKNTLRCNGFLPWRLRV